MLPPGRKPPPPPPPGPPGAPGKGAQHPFSAIPRPGTGGLSDPFGMKIKAAPEAPKVRSAEALAAEKAPFAGGAYARIRLSAAAAKGQAAVQPDATGIRLARPTNLRGLVPRKEEDPPAAEQPGAKLADKLFGSQGSASSSAARSLFAANSGVRSQGTGPTAPAGGLRLPGQGDSGSLPRSMIPTKPPGIAPGDSGTLPRSMIPTRPPGIVPGDSGTLPRSMIPTRPPGIAPGDSGSLPRSMIPTRPPGIAPGDSGSLPRSMIPTKPPASPAAVDGNAKTQAMEVSPELMAILKPKSDPPGPPAKGPPSGAGDPGQRRPASSGPVVPGRDKGSTP